jgi:hypothetical protein
LRELLSARFKNFVLVDQELAIVKRALSLTLEHNEEEGETTDIAKMTAQICALMTIVAFPLCFTLMPIRAHMITNPYAMPLLVITIRSEIRSAIITSIAHVSADSPNPSQFTDTAAAATLAIAAMVIQPK